MAQVAPAVGRGRPLSPPRALIVEPFFAADPTKARLQRAESLALGYLTAALRAAGIAADPLDAHLLGLSHDECLAHVERHQYSVVGISCSAQRAYPEAAALARAVKAVRPGLHVTIGGHFVSHVHERVARTEPAFDSVVRGEGEYTFGALIRRLHGGESLPALAGVTFRRNGEVVVNPPAPRIIDLDRLPFPDRSSMPHVLHEALAGVRYVALLGTRGCIYQCTFCSVDRPRATRSPGNIVAEMREIHGSWGVRKFRFNDDLLVGAAPDMQAWAEELAERIAAESPGLEFQAMTRSDAVNPKLFRKLRTAGFRTIFLGVESASDAVLQRFKKGTRADVNESALRVLREVGIVPELGFIMLEPRMSWADLGQNLAFLRRVGCFTRHNLTNRLNVYHGAPLYNRALADGEIVPSEDLTERHPYEFTDPKVRRYSDAVERVKQLGFDLKRDVSDVIVRLRETCAELYREGGAAAHDSPRSSELERHGRRLERLEADTWLLVFEDLYRRIDHDQDEDELVGAMEVSARERLGPLAAEVEAVDRRIDECRAMLSV